MLIYKKASLKRLTGRSYPEVVGSYHNQRPDSLALQEYPHVAKGSEEGASAPLPAELEGWELPSMRDLFWKQQKLQRGGQTVYGNVWAGVRTVS